MILCSNEGNVKITFRLTNNVWFSFVSATITMYCPLCKSNYRTWSNISELSKYRIPLCTSEVFKCKLIENQILCFGNKLYSYFTVTVSATVSIEDLTSNFPIPETHISVELP